MLNLICEAVNDIPGQIFPLIFILWPVKIVQIENTSLLFQIFFTEIWKLPFLFWNLLEFEIFTGSPP